MATTNRPRVLATSTRNIPVVTEQQFLIVSRGLDHPVWLCRQSGARVLPEYILTVRLFTGSMGHLPWSLSSWFRFHHDVVTPPLTSHGRVRENGDATNSPRVDPVSFSAQYALGVQLSDLRNWEVALPDLPYPTPPIPLTAV
jgi:hypothetical protein